MNYEEVLNANEAVDPHRGQLPFGTLQRQLVGNKYYYVLTVSPKLMGRIGFIGALKTALEQSGRIKSNHQLRSTLIDSEGGLELEFEQGTFLTLEQLIDANPALMAKSNFLDDIVEGLLDVLEKMHEMTIYHVCLSPNNVLVRKNDESPLLLLHGSFFDRVFSYSVLFEGNEDFVEPQVLGGETPSCSSDLYSLAKLIEWLCRQADIPYEYKKVLKKAMSANPEQRYQSVAEFRNDLKNHRNQKRSFLSFVAAMAIVLVCVGLYMELMPKAEDIEFVEAAPQEPEEDYLDDASFDPELIDDSLALDEDEPLTKEERITMDAYMKKAEDIFRKQFAQEADKILSKVYNNESMSANEKTFIAGSNTMRDELLKVQSELAAKAGISDNKAGSIALEVIDKLTEQKKKSLQSYGFQNEPSNEE